MSVEKPVFAIITCSCLLYTSLVSAGVGLLVLFRANRRPKQNLIIVAILLVVGIVAGAIVSAAGIVF